MPIERISTNAAPAASGAYSQGVVHGDVVYLSGQLPLDASGTLVEGGIVAETRQTFANAAAILEAAGSSLERALRVTVYLVDCEDWGAMNEVFSEIFSGALPARTAIEVGPLALGALVEVDVIAARD
jgi:2-iminobutanoate/2-iminopropanoate deaminase